MINMNEFELVIPAPTRVRGFAFSVMADDTIRFNGRLNEKFTSNNLLIFMHKEQNQIVLQSSNPDEGRSHHKQKSGVVKAVALISEMKRKGYLIPARYNATWVDADEKWICDYDDSFRFTLQKITKKKSGKPRKSGLEKLLPKEEDDDYRK